MKKTTKVLALLLCAVLLVVGSVMGTLAYLTSQDSVTNTFTVGNVAIELNEADVKADGTYENGHDTRVDANEYHLLPGHTYYKDPTVTVNGGSEDCYVRMKVKVEGLSSLKEAMPKEKFADYYDGDLFLLQKLVSDWSGSVWACVGFDAETSTYEFRYVGPKAPNGYVPKAEGNTVLEDLFTAITIPETLDNDAVAKLANVKIVVTAEAIQADGFANAAEAWAKF